MVRLRATVIALVAVVLVTGTVIGNTWVPAIPADAATTALARTDLLPASLAAPGQPDDPSPSAWLIGSACLDRVQRSAGALDLCWSVMREADADPAKDYYVLRFGGTIFGSLGSGTRWAVIKARFVGSVLDGDFETWPSGVYDQACQQVTASIAGDEQLTDICGRTVGTDDFGDLSQRVEWTCVGCVLPNHGSVAILLMEEVGVAQGTVPPWEFFGDLGD